MLFAPELALARAWTMSARGDTHGAVAAARDAARTAERGGQSAVALRALHDAVRLGDIRAADGIARASAECDCVIGQLALAHARALVGAAIASLRDVSAAACRDRHEPRSRGRGRAGRPAPSGLQSCGPDRPRPLWRGCSWRCDRGRARAGLLSSAPEASRGRRFARCNGSRSSRCGSCDWAAAPAVRSAASSRACSRRSTHCSQAGRAGGGPPPRRPAHQSAAARRLTARPP